MSDPDKIPETQARIEAIAFASSGRYVNEHHQDSPEEVRRQMRLRMYKFAMATLLAYEQLRPAISTPSAN